MPATSSIPGHRAAPLQGQRSSLTQAPFAFKLLMWTVMKSIMEDKNAQEAVITSEGADLDYCTCLCGLEVAARSRPLPSFAARAVAPHARVVAPCTAGIVRPGGLKTEPPTGIVTAGMDQEAGAITRAVQDRRAQTHDLGRGRCY